MFRAIWKFFRKDDLGQDLAEYCLLTALVALVALGIIFKVSGGIDGIWGSMNTSVSGGGGGHSLDRTPAN